MGSLMKVNLSYYEGHLKEKKKIEKESQQNEESNEDMNTWWLLIARVMRTKEHIKHSHYLFWW